MSRLKDMLERLYHDTVTDDGYCYRCQMMGGHDETCAMAEVEALLGIEWDEPPRAEEELIYLASPYSHPDPQIRRDRYEQVLEAARLLMLQGHHTWAPIVYTHQLAEAGLPTEWDFWKGFDTAMLRRCQELWVLMLDGWEQSKGIRAELRLARQIGLNVRAVTMMDIRIGASRKGDAQMGVRVPPLNDDAEHPVGCVCAECEELQVRAAMERGGGRCKKPRYANGSPIDMSRVVGALEEVP